MKDKTMSDSFAWSWRLSAVLLFLSLMVSPVAGGDWHPVRVSRDSEGWPHFFEVWNGEHQQYRPLVLAGFGNLSFSFPLDETRATLDELAANYGNFTRLWIGAGDGFSAYWFDAPRRKVDLDRWNDAFFERLDTVLTEAEKRGIVVEVMLWDRCTWWVGGGLSMPESWQEGIGHERGQNPFHPDNHFRSSAGNAPVPRVKMHDTRRIEAEPFYDTGNETWMTYQKRYMARVIDVLQGHNNVTVELINEAPRSEAALRWRKYMHTWLKSQYPQLLVQSESLGADPALAAWGRDNPGLVDMTASHDFWSYDSAQEFYNTYRGVLPGCNEYVHKDLSDIERCRRLMWGLTMGGGASWNENIMPPNGSVLTQEIHRFFNPERDKPHIHALRPAKNQVLNNDGSKYVLASDDGGEILIYVSGASGDAPFQVCGETAYRCRWFTCAGKDSRWGGWKWSGSGVFNPPASPCALQLRICGSDQAAGIPRDALELDDERPRARVIATTDGEVDDRCSMVRFLLYTNEWAVRGLIHSSSKHHWKGDNGHPEKSWEPVSWLDRQLDAYEKVYENLKQHDPDYPTPEYLREQVFVGNIAFEGDMDTPTPGSDRIVEVLLEDDDSPVWLQAWGGPNTIARALKTIQEEHPEYIKDVTTKTRLYLISLQDSTYKSYIEPEWPGLQTLQSGSVSYGAIAYRWPEVQPGEVQRFFDSTWMTDHILESHGPLCGMYEANRDGAFRSEGDSPAFLHLIPTGLRSTENPAFGGWGGRFASYSSDRWKSADEPGVFPHSILRWAEHFQNDWAARADWCVKTYAEANHAPVVRVSPGSDLLAAPGERIALSAAESGDPDGGRLQFKWLHHAQVGTLGGRIRIENADTPAATVAVPSDADQGDTVHVVCTVTDDGTPPLTRYARVIVTVND
jgi:Cellulose-binding Sde182, nucleoside hydrolase-like domain/Cellulose-binding protein Sde0182, C-terminal domain